MYKDKLKSLDDLQTITQDLKKQGKKIVHCHGCFDILHYGHVSHFVAAKRQGDILIVTVTPNKFVHKGPGRPYFSEDIRMEMIASLECVDYVALNQWETAVETIMLLKPDVYVKGKEVIENGNADMMQAKEGRISNLKAEENALLAVGGKLYLTEEVTFSSTRIINKITENVPDEAKVYLNNIKSKYAADDIIAKLESLRGTRVLVIGDAILDEYVYCEQMERSGKEPLIAYRLINSELQAGGVFAVANQTADFTNSIELLTCMGNVSYYDFLKNKFKEGIHPHIFIQNESETLVKKRYIDNYRHRKLFEVYSSNGVEVGKIKEQEIVQSLKRVLPQIDMIIIADFGHGLLTPTIIQTILDSGKFVALNCQLNAGNLGYNFITKYPRANFVSLNERELRLPLQEKSSDIIVPIEKLNNLLGVNSINITMGKAGSILYNKNMYYKAPAFTKEPVDTIGAGDAVLSVLSLLSYKGFEPELISFIGNCVGALAVRKVGNRESVSLIELSKFIKYILK